MRLPRKIADSTSRSISGCNSSFCNPHSRIRGTNGRDKVALSLLIGSQLTTVQYQHTSSRASCSRILSDVRTYAGGHAVYASTLFAR